MWQCGCYRSCSNGGAKSDNRTGLAYGFRPWGMRDSDIGEPREYDEAHRWGTWGGLSGISDERVRISNSFYTGRFWWPRRQAQPCVSPRA